MAFLSIPQALLIANFLLIPAWALSPSDQALITNCHNNYRSTLAFGTAKNISGIMPAGKNLIQFSYSSTLEAYAQAWANQCTMDHSTGNYGENLYWYSDASIANSTVLQYSCDYWWAELVEFGVQQSLVLDMGQFEKGIGHWSQMAWANTKKIGCAIAKCPQSYWQTYVVCEYDPPGNYLDEVIYEKGTACGGCSEYSGASCNGTAGLCIVA